MHKIIRKGHFNRLENADVVKIEQKERNKESIKNVKMVLIHLGFKPVSIVF